MFTSAGQGSASLHAYGAAPPPNLASSHHQHKCLKSRGSTAQHLTVNALKRHESAALASTPPPPTGYPCSHRTMASQIAWPHFRQICHTNQLIFTQTRAPALSENATHASHAYGSSAQSTLQAPVLTAWQAGTADHSTPRLGASCIRRQRSWLSYSVPSVCAHAARASHATTVREPMLPQPFTRVCRIDIDASAPPLVPLARVHGRDNTHFRGASLSRMSRAPIISRQCAAICHRRFTWLDLPNRRLL